MKIAVTAKGDQLSSPIDPRFGRAPFILVIDTATMAFEAVDNSANVNAFKGAGIQAGSMIADKEVSVLLTGYCGPKAFKTVTAAGIKVVADISGTVQEVVEQYLAGKLVYSDAPNAEGQW
ncbi:MAG: dinitrogenase iron-molybdenum cofactor biosynthesis protein [Deltaproteobacteria bacterium]|nr:MAG: dinitrogenase iron-molybdenum cofactor biosynthesis protein [Deltaproteobacteria bacterium]PIE72986.1 MAG: dinitrogenase iron-molybdenum cofactor biosynthesis protein [Deltaproteobacteria bacterium]